MPALYTNTLAAQMTQAREAERETGIRYEAMLPFVVASIGDEMVFESEAEYEKATQAADRAVAEYRANKEAGRG